MFGKKKTKKKTIINEVFGEMKYWAVQWEATAKTKMTLWSEIYNIGLSVVAASEKDGINENQENAYRNIKETMIKRQKEIEEIIEKYYNTQDEQVLISKFTPTELVFSEKGECALFADNADDDDSHDPPLGLAVNIIPELRVYTQEEYAGYIYGGGSLGNE